jgi:hypothetical protein
MTEAAGFCEALLLWRWVLTAAWGAGTIWAEASLADG